MDHISVAEAAVLCGGTLSGCGDTTHTCVGRIVIDSRQIRTGDVFAAYRGEKVDGHDYIAAAFDRGAACCIALRVPEGETRPIILVEDVQKAVERLAAEYRKRLNIPIVGVTGSVGKTSAKEMISAVLSRKYCVAKTEGNLNNQIGVPMTLSGIEAQHEIAVVEMGISDFGEMELLSSIVRPTVGVFSKIGHAHLEFLHDLDGVLRAKTEMLSHMDSDAVLVMNGDDEKLNGFQSSHRKITFGMGGHCEVRAGEISGFRDGKLLCTIEINGERIPVEIPGFGRHLIYAALEGAAVGKLFGLSNEEIAEGIAAFQTVGRRAAITETGFLTLIDDCYNANPDSVQSGLDSLLDLNGRKVFVFGDMLELGAGAEQMHRDVGIYAGEKGIDRILCVGTLAKEAADAAGEKGSWYESRDELIAALAEELQQGDLVFIKASRAMQLEQVAEKIKGMRNRKEKNA